MSVKKSKYFLRKEQHGTQRAAGFEQPRGDRPAGHEISNQSG